MKVALIMATIGRTEEVSTFLRSLDSQTYRNFELVVVDQNNDNRLNCILAPYFNRFPIIHIYSEKGLSRARNVGLQHIDADIVCFPDDDCVYEPDTLSNVVNFLNSEVRDGVTGKTVDLFTGDKKDHSMKRSINRYNVWFWSISYTVFLKKSVIDRVGSFDPELGVGSGTRYGSGEETDYLIRALQEGFRLEHIPSLRIQHPVFDFTNTNKAKLYSIGRMHVLRKHHYRKTFIMLNTGYPLLKLILNFYNIEKIKYYWYQFLGRITS